MADNGVVTYRVCVICTGNICRSPMLEFLLREAFDREGLSDAVTVDSAGTSSEESGNAADPRTLERGAAAATATTHMGPSRPPGASDREGLAR